MSFFELQYEALQEKEKNAIYVENAISWDGRRFSQEYVLGAELGVGGYGLVKKATDRKGRVYAVKLVEKSCIFKLDISETTKPDKSQKKMTDMTEANVISVPETGASVSNNAEGKSWPLEYRLLASIGHNNVPKVYGIFESGDYYQLVMQYVHGISLFQLIEKEGPLSEPVARPIFAQVINAVRYIHDLAILHNDIKDENIMVSPCGSVKLVDFGSACYDNKLPTRSYCGSETYSSPEVVRGSKYYRKTQEVWSIGVLLFVMIFGFSPFTNYLEIGEANLELPPPHGCNASKDVVHLIASILRDLPENRLDLSEIANHPWLIGVG